MRSGLGMPWHDTIRKAAEKRLENTPKEKSTWDCDKKKGGDSSSSPRLQNQEPESSSSVWSQDWLEFIEVSVWENTINSFATESAQLQQTFWASLTDFLVGGSRFLWPMNMWTTPNLVLMGQLDAWLSQAVYADTNLIGQRGWKHSQIPAHLPNALIQIIWKKTQYSTTLRSTAVEKSFNNANNNNDSYNDNNIN